MSINTESLERVQTALDDIIAGCEVEDDYTEWEDVASSSVSSVLEELDSEQTVITCAAFRRYVTNTIGSNRNMALGVREALIRALKETLDFLGEPEEPDEDDDDYEEYDSDSSYINTLRSELYITKNMEVCV